MEECDAIIFVTDARVGMTSADQDVAHYLRQSGKPVVVAANKLDSESGTLQALAGEFFKLGLGEVFPISAEHGLGVGSMMETVMGKLPPPSPEELAAREQADRAEEAAEAGEGAGFDLLIVCGFAFEPSVHEEVGRHRNLAVLMARMHADLAMGDELLKKTGAGNLFMVFGEPDIEIRRVSSADVADEHRF